MTEGKRPREKPRERGQESLREKPQERGPKPREQRLTGGGDEGEDGSGGALERTGVLELEGGSGCSEAAGIVERSTLRTTEEIGRGVGVATASGIDEGFRLVGGNLDSFAFGIDDRAFVTHGEEHLLDTPSSKLTSSEERVGMTGENLHLVFVGLEDIDVTERLDLFGPVGGMDLLPYYFAQVALDIDDNGAENVELTDEREGEIVGKERAEEEDGTRGAEALSGR